MALETELYDVLGVSSTATGGTECGTLLRAHALTLSPRSDEIKKAYRKKVLIFALSFLMRIPERSPFRPETSTR